MNNPSTPTNSDQVQNNVESARAVKELAAQAEVLDLESLPHVQLFFRLQFKVLVLDQLLCRGLTVDGAWGAIEEITLKKMVRGMLDSDDEKHRCRNLERLYDVGLAYIPSRPQWDLSTQGVLQVVDPARLVARFPDLAPWGGESQLFTLLRCRRHDFN